MKKIKTPLNYQVSEFDCVPTNFTNALVYLIGRNEIRPKMIQSIQKNANDQMAYRPVTENGDTSYQNYIKWSREYGFGGTSTESMKKACSELQTFKKDGFEPFQCQYHEKENVNKENLQSELDDGAVALLNIKLDRDRHYILVTKMDDQFIYAFDPYYRSKKHVKQLIPTSDVQVIQRHPFEYNRKITIDRLFSTEEKSYAIGEMEKRDVVYLKRQQK